MIAAVSRALLLACWSLTAAMTASAQTDRATAERLMRTSGMWSQLESIAPQIEAGQSAARAQQGTPLEPGEAERVAAITGRSFAAGPLRATAIDVIARDTDPADVPALLAWYDSEDGSAVSRAEEASAANAADPMTIAREGGELLRKLPASRQVLMARLVDACHAAEAMAATSINGSVAVQIGAASGNPSAPSMSPNELRAALEAQRPQMTARLKQLVLLAFAKTYAAVPDAVLERYAEFLQSAAGSHFTRVSLSAFDAAMVAASEDYGRSLSIGRKAART